MAVITYTKSRSSFDNILQHLQACDDSFPTPLSSRVNLHKYSMKLYESSLRFEAWHFGDLIGLVSIYENHGDNAYITNVSVLGDYRAQGVGSGLFDLMLGHCAQNNIAEVELDVECGNTKALLFYTKNGFTVHEIKNGEVKMIKYMGDDDD